jgi:hypothetical protein
VRLRLRSAELAELKTVNDFLIGLMSIAASNGGEIGMPLSADEFCPVADSFLGRLYRASPEGVAVLVKTVAPSTRAALAYYCSRRAHLESLALVIASTCSEHDLYVEAGRAGAELFAKAHAALATAEMPKLKSRAGVTLATGRLWNPPPLKD